MSIADYVLMVIAILPVVGNLLSRALRATGHPSAALMVDKLVPIAVSKLHEPEKVSALVEAAKELENDHSAVQLAKVIAAARALGGAS